MRTARWLFGGRRWIGDHKGRHYMLILLVIFAISFLFWSRLPRPQVEKAQAAVVWQQLGVNIGGTRSGIFSPGIFIFNNKLYSSATITDNGWPVVKEWDDQVPPGVWRILGSAFTGNVGGPTRLASYNGELVAALRVNQGIGVYAWRYVDVRWQWAQLGGIIEEGGPVNSPQSLVEYNGQLFLSLGGGGDRLIYRFDGSNWTVAGRRSTGLGWTTPGSTPILSLDLIVYNGQLYVSGLSDVFWYGSLQFNSPAIFRYLGGESWEMTARIYPANISEYNAFDGQHGGGFVTDNLNNLYVTASAGVLRLNGNRLEIVGNYGFSFGLKPAEDLAFFNNNLYSYGLAAAGTEVWIYCPAADVWAQVDGTPFAYENPPGNWNFQGLAVYRSQLRTVGSIFPEDRAAVFTMTGGNGTEYCPPVSPTPTTAVDNWAPVVTINGLGCFPQGQLGMVTGTASDQGSGVQQVQVALEKVGVGFYDFSTGQWDRLSEDWRAAVDTSGNGSWSSWEFNLGGLGNLGGFGEYRILAQALDRANNLSAIAREDFLYRLQCPWLKAVDGEIYAEAISVAVPANPPPPDNLRFLVDDGSNNLAAASLTAGGVALALNNLSAGGRVSERGNLPGWQVVGQEQVWPVDNGWLAARCQGSSDCLYIEGDYTINNSNKPTVAVAVIRGDITIAGEVTEVNSVLVALERLGPLTGGGNIVVEDSGLGQLKVIGGLYAEAGFDFVDRQALGSEAAVEVEYSPRLWATGLATFGQTTSYKFEEIE